MTCEVTFHFKGFLKNLNLYCGSCSALKRILALEEKPQVIKDALKVKIFYQSILIGIVFIRYTWHCVT